MPGNRRQEHRLVFATSLKKKWRKVKKCKVDMIGGSQVTSYLSHKNDIINN